MRYQVVFFDGYGTLFAGAMEKLIDVCAAVVEGESLEMDAQAFLEAWDHYFFPMVRGEQFITLQDAQAQSLVLALGDLGIKTDPEPYVRPLFEIMCSAPLFTDVNPALEQLNRVLKTGVISNADVAHMDAALSRNGLTFPVVVTSESAACYKPNPGIFEIGLSAMSCDVGAALYVGDSQEDDIVGARGTGMDVAWLNRTEVELKEGVPAPTYEIESLLELEAIVKG